MADAKISALSPASALAGTEVLPIVQSGSTKKVATDDLTVKNVRSNASTGILQITGPAAAATRTMTVPNANFTAARTDAAQTFTGVQTFSSDLVVNGIAVGKGGSSIASNTAVGVSALAANTTGTFNTAVGVSALAANNAAGYNVAVGRTALTTNTVGVENTALGTNTLQSNLDGSYNFAGGVYSLVTNASGNQNTAAGWGSLWFATASNNSAFGYKAGYNLTSGSNCAFFGYNAQPSAATVSNEYTYGDANVTKHRFVGGDIVIGTAGKGIDFSVNSSAAGMTSELLDDYEKGTWTPTIVAETGTITSYTSTGYYTKVGNIVTFELNVVVSNIGTASGSGNISLPFASLDYATAFGKEAAVVGYGTYGLCFAGQALLRNFDVRTANANFFSAGNGMSVYITGSYLV